MAGLRNLNRTSARGRVCGTPYVGVLGSAIPSGGESGAGYAYNDLSLPADASKRICGKITAWPTDGTLFAYEDTSFTFSGAADGTYTFDYDLIVDGVTVGRTTVTLTVGDGQFIAVPVATLTLNAYAPTVVATDNSVVSVPAASLTLVAYAPTVDVADLHGFTQDQLDFLVAYMEANMRQRLKRWNGSSWT